MEEKAYSDEERERLIEEREERARRYGIRPQEGRPLTPPADYPQDPEEYGDPVNYAYPIDEEHIRPALTYFNREDQREAGGYSPQEWRIIGERIAAAATQLLGARYEYRDGKVMRAEEKAVKVIEDGDRIILGGYAVVFGGQDLVGDTFMPDTDFWLDRPPGPRPVFYDHTLDALFDLKQLGSATFRQDEIGLWIEAQIERAVEYRRFIKPLIDAGLVGWSTGAPVHMVRRDGNVIRSWPIVEVSLTPTPAEPRTLGVSELHLLAAVPAVKALLDGQPQEQEGEEMDEQTISRIAEEVAARLTPAKSVAFAVQPEPQDAVKAFNIWLRRGVRQPSLEELKASTDWLNESEGALGGYLVPPEYYREVVQPLQELSALRKAGARIIRTSAPLVYLPVMTAAGKWDIVSEATSSTSSPTYPETNPSFTQVAVTIYKMGGVVRVSEEMLADAATDVWRDVLQPDFVNSMAASENYYFIVGTGTGQPQGVLAGGTLGKQAASASAITADEVIDLYHSLDPRYRENATWLMNDATASALRKLKDSNGQYLWQPGLREGSPDILLGRPVIIASSMPNPAASAKPIAFGNFAFYYIVEREGLFVQRLTERYADYGQVGFRAYFRVGGAVVNSAAIKYLQMASA